MNSRPESVGATDDEPRKSSTADLPPVDTAAEEYTAEELALSLEFALALGDEEHAERLRRMLGEAASNANGLGKTAK